MTSWAANYKVLFMNSQQIKVDGKFVRVGDTFSDKSVINWSEERQALKVIDMNTYKRYLMVAKLSYGSKQTVLDVLTAKKRLSTHDGQIQISDKVLKLEMSMDDEYDLLDSIEIATEFPVDDSHYFLGTFKYGDTIVTNKLGYSENNIIIDKNIFVVGEQKLEPRDITLRINYVDGVPDTPVYIKSIEIIIIPDSI